MGRGARFPGVARRDHRYAARWPAKCIRSSRQHPDRLIDVQLHPEPHIEKWHLAVRIGFILGSASLCWAFIVAAVSLVHTAVR